MKTAAFVPIKLNNERLANKNTKPFSNGIPLIRYILSTLVKTEGLDGVYVWCSNEAIVPYLPDGVQFLKRPEYLDLSETPFNEVLISFAKQTEADIYVLAHATAPFVKPESIEKCVNAIKSGKHDCALAARKMQEFLWDGEKPINYDPKNIPRTQDLPELYLETCCLYAYTRDLILNGRTRIGVRPRLVEISKVEAMDINDGHDFIIADTIATALNLIPGEI